MPVCKACFDNFSWLSAKYDLILLVDCSPQKNLSSPRKKSLKGMFVSSEMIVVVFELQGLNPSGSLGGSCRGWFLFIH